MTIDSTSIIKKLLLTFLIFAGLHYAKEFIMPMLLGAMLATLFLPFSNWMERKRVPRFLASFICLLLLLIAGFGIAALLGWQVSELTNDIALIKQKAIQIFDSTEEFIFTHLGVSTKKQTEILSNQQSNATAFVTVMAGSVVYVLASSLLILVYVFLFLSDRFT